MSPNINPDCIDEQFVKETALEYLKKHYSPFFQSRQVIGHLEARTIDGKYADGLILYKDGRRYVTASLEAKSKKTINVIRPYFNETHFGYRQQIFMAIMGISLFLAAYYLNLKFYHVLLFGVLTFIMGKLLFFQRSKFNEELYSTTDVFRQMKQYRANERWLAIAEDCLDEKTTVENLKNACKKEWVGLLIVSERGRVREIIKPINESGNYLSFYDADPRISGLLLAGK